MHAYQAQPARVYPLKRAELGGGHVVLVSSLGTRPEANHKCALGECTMFEVVVWGPSMRAWGS